MESKPLALTRVLSLWDAICVVIGAIIGVGIFFVPRDVASVAGSARTALTIWILGGMVALLGALTFAELGRIRPVAGGQYHLLRDAFGPLAGFLFVFCNMTAVQGGAVAIIAIVCAQNLGIAMFGAAPESHWVLSLATALIAALVVLNVLGVRIGSRMQTVNVVLKLATIAAILVVAALSHPAAAPAAHTAAPAQAGFGAIFAGVTLTLFAYGGWQQALWMAGEVVDAPRVVPRAILVGVPIVVLAYLGINVAYLHLLGYEGIVHAKALAADALSVVSPSSGRRLAAAAVALSSFGVLNAQLLAGPRLTWALARDGRFFRAFAALHPRFGTPVAAIVLVGALGAALTLGLGLERTDRLTTGVVVVDGAFFALTALALPILRRRDGRTRGTSVIDLVAIAFAGFELAAIAGSLAQRDLKAVGISALGWVVLGLLLWLLFFRNAEARAGEATL